MDGVCRVRFGSRKVRKIKRRSLDEQPVVFLKPPGSRRYLLDRVEVAELLINHGVFYLNDTLTRDPAFMAVRSRWSSAYDSSVRVLTRWAPEITADRTMKVGQAPLP